jgi:hypothetical protein
MNSATPAPSGPRQLTTILLGWLLAACPLLSCAGFGRPGMQPPEDAELVVSISRELVSSTQHTFVRTIRRRAFITDPQVRDFFRLYPDLAQGVPQSDLDFLLKLAGLPAARGLLAAGTDGRELEDHLAGRQTVPSDSDRLSGRTDNREQVGLLNPVDRIKVSLLLEALRCADLANRLAACLRQDLLESDAEYGGFLLLTGEEQAPVEFVPIRSRTLDDWEYRPPAGLFLLTDFALWHNHAHGADSTELEQVDNSSQAGPSGTLGCSLTGIGGDLWGCYLHTVDAVVITPTGGRTFNVDFVSSEGAVVDLGLYSWSAPE